MCVHISETTVDSQGRVILDHLPFRPGEKVDVVIRSHNMLAYERSDLKGSVLRYDDPFQRNRNPSV